MKNFIQLSENFKVVKFSKTFKFNKGGLYIKLKCYFRKEPTLPFNKEAILSEKKS